MLAGDSEACVQGSQQWLLNEGSGLQISSVFPRSFVFLFETDCQAPRRSSPGYPGPGFMQLRLPFPLGVCGTCDLFLATRKQQK